MAFFDLVAPVPAVSPLQYPAGRIFMALIGEVPRGPPPPAPPRHHEIPYLLARKICRAQAVPPPGAA
jgi:hypothetical protein